MADRLRAFSSITLAIFVIATINIAWTSLPAEAQQSNQGRLLNSEIVNYISNPEQDLCGSASPGDPIIDPERGLAALSSSNPPVEGRHPGYCPHFGYLTTGNPHSGTNIVEYFVGGVDFGTPRVLAKYVMKFPIQLPTYYETRQIKSFSIQGSNDATAWTTLFTGETLYALGNPANSVQEYPLTGIGPYRYYRIWAHTNWGWDFSGYTNAYIFRWEWWGKIEPTLAISPASGTAPIQVTASLYDRTPDNPLSATINWGDGASDSANGTASHTYTVPGTYTVTAQFEDAQSTVLTKTVTVLQRPIISLAPQSGPPTLNVTASAKENGSNLPLDLTVNWGDGTTSADLGSITHAYTNPGHYTVAITSRDITETFSVTVYGPLTLTVNPQSGRSPLTITATIAETGSTDPVSGAIDWGDGVSGDSITGSKAHTYSTPGSYQITVTALGQTKSVNLIVQPPLTSIIEPTSGFAPLSVSASVKEQGTNNTVTSPATINWGDGGQPGSFSGLLAHVYAQPGAYTATITVEGNLFSHVITVAGEPVLDVTPQAGISPLTVNASLMEAGTQHAVSGTIDWGDGQTESINGGKSHAYASPGQYQLVAQAGNVIKTATVTVYDQPEFTVMPLEGIVPLTVNATLTEVNTGATLPATITWGDNSPSESLSPSASHTFAQPGTYTVTTNVYGVERVASIVAKPVPPQPVLELTPATGTAPLSIQAVVRQANSTQRLNGVIDWGDNSTPSSTVNGQASHVYEVPGTYTATITVDGMTDAKTVVVNDPLPVSLQIDQQSGIAPLTVIAKAIQDSTGLTRPMTINWGDGSPPQTETAHIRHTYAQPGTYAVTAQSDLQTLTASIEVLPVPAPTLQLLAAAGPPPLNVTAKVTLPGVSVLPNMTIDWGDGSAPQTIRQQLSHVYQTLGEYRVIVRTDTQSAEGLVSVIPDQPTSMATTDIAGVSPFLVTVTLNRSREDLRTRLLIDWGDGSPVRPIGTKALHLYITPGTHTIRVANQVEEGQTPNIVLTQTVEVAAPPPPTVELDIRSFDDGHAPTQKLVRSKVIPDHPRDRAKNFIWNLTDPSGITTELPVRTGSIRLALQDPGEYTLALHVETRFGGTADVTQAILVEEMHPFTIAIDARAPRFNRPPAPYSIMIRSSFEQNRLRNDRIDRANSNIVVKNDHGEIVAETTGTLLRHTFLEPGVYQVEAGATTSTFQLTDQAVTTIIVDPNQPPVIENVLAFWIGKRTNTPHYALVVKSSDPDGQIVKTRILVEGQEYSNRLIRHLFETQGAALITVSITDNSGATTTEDWLVTLAGDESMAERQ